MDRTSLCLALLLTVPLMAMAHVRLLDPPARWPARDFLNTFDTPKPCGVPAGERDNARSYKTGDEISVVWASPYVHNGGYKIEILDANNEVVAVLVDTTSGSSAKFEEIDSAADVKLPDEPCEGCTLRLMRQALEWGPSYQFMSCADVDIVDGKVPQCFNGGELIDGSCACPASFSGDKCQIEVECKAFPDCGQDGECVKRDNEAPARVCYCGFGRFGRQCEKESLASPDCVRAYVDDNNTDCYERKIDLGDEHVAYMRTIGDEIEMIVDMATTSWVGVGFRSVKTDKSCKLAYLKSEKHFRAIPLVATFDSDNANEVATAEPDHGVEDASAEPEHSDEDSSAEPGYTADSDDAGSETTTSATAESVAVTEEDSVPTTDSSATPASETASSSEDIVVGAARRRGAAGPVAQPATEPESEPEPTIKFHPEAGDGGVFARMDCLDMVIGSVVGGRQRIMDAFTLDKSTPQRDEVWGGEDSLTNAWAFERSNHTIIAFRRPLTDATHWSDVTLGEGELMLAWAHGGLPAAAREVEKEHYADDYLRYHQGNRGYVDSVSMSEGGAAALVPAFYLVAMSLICSLLL